MTHRQGFTLIELAIVLVIIGLIIGGVLAGKDLARSASVRAQITQIERFNAAVNTFRTRYNALPGDLNAAVATQFGFAPRGNFPGSGDGNGVIEGGSGGTAQGFRQAGETVAFWSDLTVGYVTAPINVNLIEGSYNGYFAPNSGEPTITAATASSYYPPAKIGRGNSVYVYSTGGVNYYGIAPITVNGGPSGGNNALTATMTVQEAYQMDAKVDDGFPASGNVTATWISGNGTSGGNPQENAPAPTVNAAASDSAASCYNSGTTAGAYSITVNNGANPNCALSFRFQ